MVNDLGVGWDALPQSITHSRYLSANDVAQIASLHSFPTKEELEELRKADFVQEIYGEHKGNPEELKKAIHLRAKVEIERGSLPLAFQLLMLLEN
jgi:hypothetical protein